MPLFTVVIHKSNGGRASHDTFSNTHYIRTDVAVDTPEMKEIVAKIVDAEQLSHLTETFFLRAHIKQLAENAINTPADEFRSIELKGNGARSIVTAGVIVGTEQPDRNNPATAKEVCVVVKRQAAKGHNGVLYYRNMLLMDDIKKGEDGKFILVNEANSTLGEGQNAMIAALNLPLPNDAVFVLPNKPGLTVQTSRDIVQHTLGGVTLIQTTRRRRSIKQLEENLDQRRLNEFARAARRILGGLAPAALTGAAAASFAAILAEAATFYTALPAARAAMLALPAILALL